MHLSIPLNTPLDMKGKKLIGVDKIIESITFLIVWRQTNKQTNKINFIKIIGTKTVF